LNNFAAHTSLENQQNSGEFRWSQSTQGIVLGAFDYGYIWFQIVGENRKIAFC
jgi:hypothetical protein